jgi:tetratricopeptide (TPR) repeat protein
VASLVRTSGGNPLFLEELAASIHEGGTGSLGGVPSTIQSIIAARLDGLTRDERGLLQTASVVGRIFWHGAIRAMGWDGASLDAALETLEGRDLILRQATSRLSGDTEYLFKHVLTMEVAYGTLPNRSRRKLHATVARYLESTMGDRVRGSASLLARHWKRAGEPARSVPYLLLAADVAAKAAAKEEAITLLTEAIEIADEIDDEALRNQAVLRRVRVRIDIGEHQAALRDVEPLLVSPDLAVRGQALRARCRLAFVLTDAAGLQTHARETREIAAEIGDAHLKTRAEALVGEAAFLHGDRTTFLDAAARADRSWPDDQRDAEYGYTMSLVPLARYWDGEYEDGARLARAAFDLGTELSSVYLMIFNVGGLAINLTGLSRYEEAFGWLQRGIEMGRDWESKPQWTGRLLNMHAGALREVGDLAAARTVSREGLEAGARAGFLGASVSAGIDLAMADVVEGEIGRAEQQMPGLIRAVEDFHGWHQWLWTGRLLDIEAEIAVGSGRHEDAADKTTEALRYLDRYPRPKYEAKAHTLRGRAMLGLGLLDEAGVSFRRAIALADGLHQSMLHWPALDGLASALEGSGLQTEAESTRQAARAMIDDIVGGLAVERRSMFLALPSVVPILDRTAPPGP